ncbi:hypothetical protein H6P81_017008 [Aristolochia fimbriata]|uniref:Leucine-rich repeat-containing N-terminal plant-type domain-containing protein n=1 Tax=Aristolochia fimbriata TaxID=158543 RepID=A0AAV7DXB6_ARIFI|nr:hypothetical protein H6P81_017008 [Aristolochia fimbriata]
MDPLSIVSTTVRLLRLLLLHLLLLFAFLSNIVIADHHSNGRGCMEKEREALLKFKNGVSFDQDPHHHHRLSSWAGDNCCTWFGVVCDNVTGHVIELSLPNPDGFNESSMLRGRNIDSSSLADLRHLLHLDLSFNNFYPTPFPTFIGTSIQHLRYLNLSYVGFVGDVPPHMVWNLSNLHVLDLSGNENMTIGNIGWLSHLSSLQQLDLSSVNISGKAPWFEAVNKLSSLSELRLRMCNLENVYASHPRVNFTDLKVLDLSWNNFRRSALPNWLSHLTNLERLYVRGSNFTGPIPSYLGRMSALKLLDLGGNKFEGSVPESLGQLSGLVELDISDNALEGNISELHFSNLSKLEYLAMSQNSFKFSINSTSWVPPFQLKSLDLSSCSMEYSRFPYWLQNQKNIDRISMSNASLHGSPPEWFWKILANATYINLSNNMIKGKLPGFSSRLETLHLTNNSFSGSLPNNWEQDSHLVFLALSHNRFSGTIPSSFGNLTELKYLYLETNDLSGQLHLPMKNLQFLDLRSNRFSGKIPEWIGENAPNEESPLILMDLSNNVLSGTIPSSFGNLTKLVSLYLRNNSLSGQLPLSMKNMKNLLLLDLHSNRLTGKIPSWIGENLPNLRILNLRSNRFHGEVPTQLSHLASLQYLDMAHNNLSGSIPKSFKNFKEMANTNNNNSPPFRYHFGYGESMWIVMKGREFFYQDLFQNNRKGIDLSMNQLSGNIPEELTELKGLQNLNLSGNFLQGPIPNKIGEMRKLQSLDLSKNRLSGVIPPTLSALTFLGYLNVSNNNLSGKIPFTGQLTTFESPSYIGNEKLCGSPLSNKCPEDETRRGTDHISQEEEDEYEEDEIEPWLFYIITGSGFIGGISSVFGVLIANESWRATYYRFLDGMFERFIAAVVLWRIRIKRKLLKD